MQLAQSLQECCFN